MERDRLAARLRDLQRPAKKSDREQIIGIDCTNEDHRSVICFRVGGMHWQPAERRNEHNCRRSMRPAHGRYVRR